MNRSDIEITRLNEQIADLKAELVELSGKVQLGASEVERAARPATNAIRENPGTISSVAVTAGLIGVAVGYILGSGASGTHTNVRWH